MTVRKRRRRTRRKRYRLLSTSGREETPLTWAGSISLSGEEGREERDEVTLDFHIAISIFPPSLPLSHSFSPPQNSEAAGAGY